MCFPFGLFLCHARRNFPTHGMHDLLTFGIVSAADTDLICISSFSDICHSLIPPIIRPLTSLYLLYHVSHGKAIEQNAFYIFLFLMSKVCSFCSYYLSALVFLFDLLSPLAFFLDEIAEIITL